MIGITRKAVISGLSLVLFGMGAGHGVAQGEPELRIATIISVTGAASSLGAPERRAVDFFEKTLRDQTDLPFSIKLINYDDASDPTLSVNLTRKAIEEDRVHVVVCCTTTPGSMALLETISAAETPMISMSSAAAVAEPAAERRFTFKTPMSDRLMIGRTLDYMKSQGVEKIGFFGLDDSYGEAGLEELRKLADEAGVELVATERFSRQDTNFTPQALRLRQGQPDAIYIHAIPPSANLAHEALGRVGWTGPIYHGGGSSINAFIEIGKNNVEGAIVGVGALSIYDQISETNPLRPVLAEFAQIYDGAYGEGAVDLFAGQAWDGVKLAAHGFSEALKAGTNPDDLPAARIAVRDALENTKEYLGVNGVFNFSRDDHLGLDQRATFLAQVKDGRFILIEE